MCFYLRGIRALVESGRLARTPQLSPTRLVGSVAAG
jgi:hypothetical protein